MQRRLLPALLALGALRAFVGPLRARSALNRPRASNAGRLTGVRGVRVARQAEQAEVQELTDLQTWMQEQGGHLGAVSFVDLPGFKFSLVADTALKPGDTLLRVPSLLHISPSYVRQTEFGKLFEALDDSAVLALGLLAEAAKGEKSKWWPYIRMLPSSEELHIPLLWPEEERRQLLAGSPLDMATEQQLLQLSEQWTDIAAVVKELPELNSESWTKERYLWAHAIVLTRALPFGNELSLIPGLDLANHELGSKNTCSIGVATADGQVVEATDAKQLEENEPEAVLTAGSEHGAGDQIFIDYDGGVGLRLAWEMVHTYGFVPNNLPAYAGRPVFFEGVSAEDGMAKQKQALFEALGADPTVLEGFWHELRPVGSQCRSMAPKLRLANLRPEDGPLAEALKSWRAEPRATYEALQKPISAENEDRVKNQIVGAVKEALAELPAEKELQDKAQRAAEGPQQIRETLAAKVLLGERLALETCLEQWNAA
ncbi:Actin-histidine N-methyltransferase (Endothelial differentiation inhibitory protein D10) (Protein-L-histidine N-tele-methyltransferase) (SET domain-containing protein 3) [Durusdinium trenchii]|uniref:Actin-histidine N-methyltransferase (Endothelial differentiation inhibitory protein D10) (Protein-L-histidine N-tele-methyltransferase) (SET domain-containing protein 3) n=1 Tax=Durusdinium trenchii TaxID=1381693 RepID=A0ABP0RKJ8_9DINO